MTPLELVNLPPLMERSAGSRDVVVALLDGPVAKSHPDLANENLRTSPGAHESWCSSANTLACSHGTFVAGILAAKRGSPAPAICPGCTLLVHPIFSEFLGEGEPLPSTTPEQLAEAIIACVDAGASVLNLSAAITPASLQAERALQDSLDYARRRGAVVVAAAGNQASVGASALTGHPWVIPVVGYTAQGWPMAQSNLGSSIGRRGLGAPGKVTSLAPEGQPRTLEGTSFAAPFVAATIALLWSQFPTATPVDITSALSRARGRRRSITPPLFDAWAAYQYLVGTYEARAMP